MPRLSLDLGFAVFGVIFTIVLVVLDKAGKLKGPALFWLLALAALMTLPLALGNSIVANSIGAWKYWVRGLAVATVILTYWGIGIWISSSSETPKAAESEQQFSNPPPTETRNRPPREPKPQSSSKDKKIADEPNHKKKKTIRRERTIRNET